MAAPQSSLATHSVLTQPLLFSIITSFQRGVPAVAQSLVLRFIADGFAYCKSTHELLRDERQQDGTKCWVKQLSRCSRVATLLHNNVRPDSQWLSHVLPEAIGKYHTPESIRVLEIWLRTSAAPHDRTAERTVKQIVHRVSESAAAFGCVDLLQWLYDRQRTISFSQRHQRHLAHSALRYSHIAVLLWIEQVFGASVLDGLMWERGLRNAMKHGHVEMVQLLVNRRLAELPHYAIRSAINRNHIDILRYLLPLRALNTEDPGWLLRDRDLAELSILRGHLRIVQCLFAWKPELFSAFVALRAICYSYLDVAQFLLENADTSMEIPVLEDHWFPWLSRLDVLRTIAAVDTGKVLPCSVLLWTHSASFCSFDTIRILLSMSNADDIIKAFVWAALYDRKIAELIITAAGSVLPSDARRLIDELEPHDNKPWTRTYYIEILESFEGSFRLYRADIRELRAITLYLAWQRPDSNALTELVDFEARRCPAMRVFHDKRFAKLCVDLCPSPRSRIQLQSLIEG